MSSRAYLRGLTQTEAAERRAWSGDLRSTLVLAGAEAEMICCELRIVLVVERCENGIGSATSDFAICE